MKDPWQKIFSTRKLAEAMIVQGMLEENNIPARMLNKQDSSYLNFGEIDIYVPVHLSVVARQLVSNNLLN